MPRGRGGGSEVLQVPGQRSSGRPPTMEPEKSGGTATDHLQPSGSRGWQRSWEWRNVVEPGKKRNREGNGLILVLVSHYINLF